MSRQARDSGADEALAASVMEPTTASATKTAPPIQESAAANGDDTADANDDEDKLVLWDYSLNLRGALGYKDNVLLRPFRQESSAFWQTSLQLSAAIIFAIAASVVIDWPASASMAA